jgi:hypothetical protein
MTDKERREIEAALEKEAELRQRINESSLEYLKLLKDIKNLHKNINEVERDYLKQQKRVADAKLGIITLSAKELEIEEEKEKILEENLNKLKKTKDEYTKIAKEAGTLTKSLGVFTQVRKDVGAISSTVTKGYNTLKGWAGLFDMDKKIRMSALSMGLLDTQTKTFRDNLFYASQNTLQFGVDIGELAEIQAKFSDELGRTVMLSQQGLVSMAAMAKATGLGAEGAAQLAGDFDRIGISAEGAADFIEKTMNDSSKMGLNASKVVKNIQQNMKMLNKYNFKGGVNGLKKMAESMTKLGLDMNTFAPMADKLFDIEGAVDMSAQLQVLGGEWAKLADPFDLMYKARNDMEGLAKEMVDASAASARWSSTDHEYKISALEMHTLRKVAEQTGVSYEELAASAKKAAQFVGIRKQMRFGFDKDTKEFIENTAQFNDKGEAEITINGSKKLVSQLTNMDKTALDTMMAEKKTLKERAESAQTFDETLTNLINQVKTLLLPVLEGLDTTLRPVVKKFSEAIADPKFLETIKSFGESIGKFIGGIGKFIFENPKWSLALFGVFEAAKWILNGVALGTGFNMTASIGGPIGMLAKSVGVLAAGVAGWAAGKWIGGKLSEATGNKSTEEGDTASMWGAGIGAAVALGIGAALAIPTGGLSMLGAAALVGGGALAGSAIGKVGGDSMNQDSNNGMNKTINDGVMFNPRDKFLKLNDGAMIAGTNVNGNKDLANAIMSKKYSDESSNSNSNNTNTISKVEFGELTINGKLMVETPGSPNMGVDLLKSPQFINELTKKIMIQLNVNKNQIQRA